MALTESYLMTTKNLVSIFDALIHAQPPSKFTLIFLENLDFKSTNDRLYIQMLRALGFIDSSGVPQERYFHYIDQTQSKQVLAEGIKEAYQDIFNLNIKAHEMSESEVKNKLKTLFQGSKSDKVLGLMATTFKALCNYADFSKNKALSVTLNQEEVHQSEKYYQDIPRNNPQEHLQEIVTKKINTELHYNIQIHLPETRDMAVYDAIFESLKKHLL